MCLWCAIHIAIPPLRRQWTQILAICSWVHLSHLVRDSVISCFACEILRNRRIAGCLELVREEGLYFWQKPKVAKAFVFGAPHGIILI